MAGERILIVDDEQSFCEAKSELLNKEGFQAEWCTNPKEALKRIIPEVFELVLSDLAMEEMDGIELIKKIQEISPETITMVITGYASIESAVEAIKAGAYDYLPKAATHEELMLKINHALEKRRAELEIQDLKDTLKERHSFANLVGKNENMQEVYHLIRTVAEADVAVLIRGETGTGKELVARAVHFNSSRRDNPFVVVHCAAISETLVESELFGHEKGAFTGAVREKPGKLELAKGGTVFLDEIGDMSFNLQAKLLRVLQDKTFERVGGLKSLTTDARIVSATNRNLEQLIKEGKFREDLYYRIKVVMLELPPLRERVDDIELLVEHFLNKFNRKFNKKVKGFSSQAAKLLFSYSWPGNVRELENMIGKLVLLKGAGTITDEELAKELPGVETPELTKAITENTLAQAVEAREKEYIETLLKMFKGQLNPVAERAGIDRKTLYRKMKSYKIRKEDFIPRE